MPFGVHKDKPIQDVPASYLHWLWTDAGLKKESGDLERSAFNQNRATSRTKLANYIWNNLHRLKLEHSDGIWT